MPTNENKMECWKWVAKEVYQWRDKRTSKWVYVLRQHNICKWLAKRNRKVLSWSSKGLIFFRADIGCERVFLKKLAFFLASQGQMLGEVWLHTSRRCQQHKYHSESSFSQWWTNVSKWNGLGWALSYPGNLTKSNSEDLWSSLVSTPELHSNKSLCQESDIP